MIRIQQAQLQALQATHPNPSLASSAIEDSFQPHFPLNTIPSAGVSPGAGVPQIIPQAAQPIPIPIPATTPIRTTIHPRSSFDLSRSVRAGSRTPSRNASPGLPLRSPSIGPLPTTPQYPGVPGGIGRQASEEWLSGVSPRDEAQFYQAEAQTMTRENQMLRLRIRELEKEVREKGSEGSAGTGRRGSVAYEPATPSGLIRGVSARGESNRGSGRGDRVSEMGGEDEEDASPRTTPAPKGEVKAESNALARDEKE